MGETMPPRHEPPIPGGRLERAAEEALAYAAARREHWDEVARRDGGKSPASSAYHRRLERVYQHLVSPGLRVLEVGCGRGDLLAALAPAYGVGVDLSPLMVEAARKRHDNPRLTFLAADAHELDLGETFDIVMMSDLVNDVWDVQRVLEAVRRHCTPRTRLVLNTYSRLWQVPLGLARQMGLANPLLPQNWLTVPDLSNLLRLERFEPIRHQPEVMLPLPIPGVATLANRVLVKLWPLKHLAVTNVMVARPRPLPAEARQAVRSGSKEHGVAKPRVSVVVAARNEAGHIDEILRRTPEMGGGTELIFVEGGSSDGTWDAIQDVIEHHPERELKAYQQTGKGKGDAVRLGFEHATGDVLMILDADMTVPPEDLPRFYEVLTSGQAEFVNGVRLVYPMQERAMRRWNLLGNKFFSLAFTWLLGQPVKDTLCGTKVLSRADYARIVANRAYFGDFDPFGDFDLLFGAARQSLQIVDLPVRYRERHYGDTNISRWSHGWLLLKMTAFAARRIKFI